MGGAGSVHRPHHMNVVPARGAAKIQVKVARRPCRDVVIALEKEPDTLTFRSRTGSWRRSNPRIELITCLCSTSRARGERL